MVDLGARGLRSLCEAVMLDIMYEAPTETKYKRFVVTRAMVSVKQHTFKFHAQPKVSYGRVR